MLNIENNIALLSIAIKKQQPLGCTYAGMYRKLCPHILGWKNGTLHALCWQYGGESHKGNLPEWRCIPVGEISHTVVLNEPWQTSPNYSVPLQSCVDKVIVCLPVP